MAIDVQQTAFDIGLVLTDDLPGLFLVGVFVHQCHFGAELDCAVQLLGVDHIRQAEDALQFFDAAFDERLFFTRRVILGVLRQVAMLAGFGDGLDDGRALDGFQRLEFDFQRGMARRGSLEFCPLLFWSTQKISGPGTGCAGTTGLGWTIPERNVRPIARGSRLDSQ